MKKLFSLSLAALALLALASIPASAADPAPAALDLAALLAPAGCAADATPAAAVREPGGDIPAFFRAACVSSKTCGGWRVTGCCGGGPARQEQKRNCELRCCIGSQCLSSGTVTETQCVQGPC